MSTKSLSRALRRAAKHGSWSWGDAPGVIVRAIGANAITVVNDGNGTRVSDLAIDRRVRGFRVRFYPRAERLSAHGASVQCARLKVTK